MLAAVHLALTYAVLQRFEVRLLITDVGLVALALLPAAWYIGSLTEERQRHAAQGLLLDLLEEPRNIRDTATLALMALIEHDVARAGVIALAAEQDDELRVIAAAGYPEGWARVAPPARILNVTEPSLRRERELAAWVAPVGRRYGRQPWVARVPLLRGGDVIGLMLLVARRPGAMSDPAVLPTIGGQLSAALDHAALYEAAYRRERDLEEQDQRRREFMAAIAHEIRTPLTSIQAFAELLQIESGGLEGPAEELVTSLTHGVDRLNRLVSDLIDLGRAGGQHYDLVPAEVDVRDVMVNAQSLLRPVFLVRDQALTLDMPERPLRALLDPRHLEQVVLSVLSNANRHAPPGSEVVLRAYRSAEGCLRVEIEDSGPGIAPEERERIFEPYYRVRREDGTSVPGSGLGLAVARRLLDPQGGRIWVEDNDSGVGVRFCIELRPPGLHV